MESAGAAQLDVAPAFDEELVVVAPKSHARIRSARDVGADTVIAFPAGCAYRRRLQRWYAASELVPERVLELASYHAIVACVAAGTGIAIMPQSVLNAVRGGENLAVSPLAKNEGRITTCLVWRKGESSPALKVLKAELAETRKTRKSGR